MVRNSTGAQTTLPFVSTSQNSAPTQIQPHESGLESKIVGFKRERFLILPPAPTPEFLKEMTEKDWFVPPPPEVQPHILSY
jgi:hypothetical protein